MAWICKNCGYVNVDANYKCIQCNKKQSENNLKTNQKTKLEKEEKKD